MSAIVKRRILAGFLSSVCLLPVAPGIARAQQPVQQDDQTLKQIASAWSKRAADVKTAKLVWREERTQKPFPDLGRAKAAPDDGGNRLRKAAAIPSLVTYETVCTLFVDGNCFALSEDVYDPRADAMESPTSGVFKHAKAILQGGEYRFYSAAREGRYGFVQLRSADRYRDDEGFQLRPVMFTLRPLIPKLGRIDLSSYHVSVTRPTLKGISCLLLAPTKVDRRQTLYWVDPARDYLIVRSSYPLNKKYVATTDVEYDESPTHVWIPKRWDVQVTAGGNFVSAKHAHVLKATVNQPIAPTEFTLEDLPVGTVVRDSRSGKLIESRVLEPDR
jgi:hypothetical protein